jgi:preprotein translocase subunit SecA
MIKKTQERIEHHFFEMRKHVLEYDDVLNSQREHIYGMRREVLLGKHIREDLTNAIRSVVGHIVANAWNYNQEGESFYDYEYLYGELNEIFPFIDYAKLEDLKQFAPGEELQKFCVDLALKAYQDKVESVGEETMQILEQRVMLQVINDKWMEHLQIIDYIREGIGLRGYGQVDPLVAYKRETFDLFQNTLKQINEISVRTIYRAQIQPEAMPQMMEISEEELALNELLDGTVAQSAQPTPQQTGNPGQWPANADPKRVGRNDPCPCGSGKKFKNCHYPTFRTQRVI